MKKRDIVLIISILLASLFLWIISVCVMRPGGYLHIYADQSLIGVYDLQEDIEIKILDSNICTIQDGAVFMSYADCPDLVCVHTSAISKTGQTIICMPNKVVLEITDSTDVENIDIMVR